MILIIPLTACLACCSGTGDATELEEQRDLAFGFLTVILHTATPPSTKSTMVHIWNLITVLSQTIPEASPRSRP